MSTSTLIPLARADRPDCGGKARGLARLIGAGLRVPPGFVILDSRTDPRELLTAYAALGAGKVAVRSSARSEDGEQASFAGQYQTLLGVLGERALGEAVERCFASADGARVSAYARALADADASMAVIVQQMVDARCAGVLFTCDPVTGADDCWIVEAVAGLGEALVGGHARPDRHRIGRRGEGREIERELAGDSAVLDDPLLAELLEQAERALSLLGGPLDFEWAIDDTGAIHWLQARPVTRVGSLELDELDTRLAKPSPGFTRYNIGEVLPGAITPLTATTVVETINHGYRRANQQMGIFPVGDDAPERLLVMRSGHLFMNMHGPYLLAASVAGASKQAADRSLGGRVFEELDELPMLGSLTRAWTAARMLPVLRSAASSVVAIERELAEHRRPPPPTSTEAIARLDQLLRFGADAWTVHTLASNWSGLLVGVLEGMIGGGAPLSPELRGRLAELLRGLGELESADVGVELELLARSLRADQQALAQLASRDNDQLLAWLRDPSSGSIGQRFSLLLQRHGHRCVRELELREVCWGADPTPVLDSLRALATAPARRPPPRRIEFDELPVPPRIRRAIRWLLPKVHESIRLRERCKSLAVHAARLLEPCCVAIGEQLVASGSLPELDLIYFLTHDELVRSAIGPADGELARIALRRRRAHAQQASLRFAMVYRDDPKPLPPTREPASARQLIGTPVSPGIVEGLARVARTPEQAAALRPGEVLIVPFTDAGWTPYFSIAAGLATEIGGTLSHGSVIARELGLPAVVDLPGATECFATGQRVRLDANRGVLELIDQPIC